MYNVMPVILFTQLTIVVSFFSMLNAAGTAEKVAIKYFNVITRCVASVFCNQ